MGSDLQPAALANTAPRESNPQWLSHHFNPAIGYSLHYYSSRHPHGPQSESGGVLPRLRLETVQPHEGEFANRLPPILKPHEAASDRGSVPLHPRGVHPAIELAGCTAGIRPPGLAHHGGWLRPGRREQTNEFSMPRYPAGWLATIWALKVLMV